MRSEDAIKDNAAFKAYTLLQFFLAFFRCMSLSECPRCKCRYENRWWYPEIKGIIKANKQENKNLFARKENPATSLQTLAQPNTGMAH